MTGTLVEWFRLGATNADWAKVVDTYLNSVAPDTNYGTSGDLIISGDLGGLDTKRILFRFEIPPSASIGASPVTGITLYLRNDGTGTDGTNVIEIFNSLKNWLETAATWNEVEGTIAWATAGAFGAADYGQMYSREDVNPNAVGGEWDTIVLDDLVALLGLGVGDVISLLIKGQIEVGDAIIMTYESTESAVATPTWPAGSPATWGVGAGDYYRPVIAVSYADAPPTAVTDLKAEPSASDPTRAKVTWTRNADSDFANYALRQSTAAAVTGASDILNMVGWGAAKIPAGGVEAVEMSAAQTWGENDLLYLRLYVEDASNTGVTASPSPIISIIRPNLDQGGGYHTNASSGTVPRLFKASDLTVAPASLAAQDRVTIAIAGLGDSYAEGATAWPKRIDVDWGDGLEPTRFVPVVSRVTSNVASAATSITVQDPSGFHVADVALIVDEATTQFDIFRITAVTATTISIDTDLAGYSQGVRYAYLAAESPIVYTLPTHNLPKQFTAANIRGRLFNSLGYASDWTATTGSPASAAVNPVAKIDANRNGIGASGDVIRFAGSQSYSRMSDKPILNWNWTFSAGTHGGVAQTPTTTVPYNSHTHSYASDCNAALTVDDGTNTSASVNMTVTYTAVSNFAITSLADNYTSRRAKDDPGCIVIDGVDIQESVYSTAKLRYVDYAVSAHRDADADTVPDDLESIISAIVSAKGITDTLPTSTGTASVTGKLYGEVESQQIAPAVWVISFTVVYPRPT